MAKFNLNQILSTASREAASGGEVKPRPVESRFEKLSVFDLVPSEDNFYSMREIEELKAAIEIAGKVLQNLVVVPLKSGKYKVIAGHRRRLASIGLVEEGKPQYEFVPCDIEPNEEAAEDQEIRDGLTLIVTNSQREKTAWDKIEEVRYLREVLEKARTRPRFVDVLRQIVATVFSGAEVQADGTRDFIAKVLHTTPAQIGRYDAIIRHLCPEFKAELKEDRINVSTAYELSGLTPEGQKAAFEEYRESGTISIKEARAKKPDAQQPVAEDNPMPAVPPENPQGQPVTEPPKKPGESPCDHCFSGTYRDCDGCSETTAAAEVTPTTLEPPAESGFRKQDPPEPSEVEETPAPPAAPPAQRDEAEERARMVFQLQSLRDYCEAMNDSDTDGGSRVWALDVDALEFAIYVLNKGCDDGN